MKFQNILIKLSLQLKNANLKRQLDFIKEKRLSVVSTEIGADNIDIVLNELDAIINIDLDTRKPKETLTQLNIVRIGTSGSLQVDIPVNSFLMSTYALDINGMLHSYQAEEICHPEIEQAFIKHTNWNSKKCDPIIIANSKSLEDKISTDIIFKGMTVTAGGFYGPQGRVLRLALQDPCLNTKIDSFNHDGIRVTNLEMETSAIYGLCNLLGHNACSMNAIIANRASGTFSTNPEKIVSDLIKYTLDKLVE